MSLAKSCDISIKMTRRRLWQQPELSMMPYLMSPRIIETIQAVSVSMPHEIQFYFYCIFFLFSFRKTKIRNHTAKGF